MHIIKYIAIYMVNPIRRKPGQNSPVGKTQKDLLRIIHSFKNGIDEPELRELVKKNLNIQDKSDISKHLKKLESSQLISCDTPLELRGKTGKKNIWYSGIHDSINSGLEKYNKLERNFTISLLTDSQKELVDFLVKYSNTFLEMISRGMYNSYLRHREKIERHQHLISYLHQNKMPPFFDIGSDNPGKYWLLPVSEICITSDCARGELDCADPGYIKEYENLTIMKELSEIDEIHTRNTQRAEIEKMRQKDKNIAMS